MNEQIIWTYLGKIIENDYGVAGLMGNLRAESGLNPKNLQNSFEKKLGLTDDEYVKQVDNGIYTNFVYDKAGIGLAQWTYWSRKQKLLDYAKKKNKSIGDLDMQLEYLCEELSKSYPTILSALKNAKSVREASDIVVLQFEKPADQSLTVLNKRASYSTEYYEMFHKTALYRVQLGAFKSQSNAEKLKSELKQKGFDCIIKFVNGLYKCQTGAFKNRQNSELLKLRLEKLGYKPFIVYN